MGINLGSRVIMWFFVISLSMCMVNNHLIVVLVFAKVIGFEPGVNTLLKTLKTSK